VRGVADCHPEGKDATLRGDRHDHQARQAGLITTPGSGGRGTLYGGSPGGFF